MKFGEVVVSSVLLAATVVTWSLFVMFCNSSQPILQSLAPSPTQQQLLTSLLEMEGLLSNGPWQIPLGNSVGKLEEKLEVTPTPSVFCLPLVFLSEQKHRNIGYGLSSFIQVWHTQLVCSSLPHHFQVWILFFSYLHTEFCDPECSSIQW